MNFFAFCFIKITLQNASVFKVVNPTSWNYRCKVFQLYCNILVCWDAEKIYLFPLTKSDSRGINLCFYRAISEPTCLTADVNQVFSLRWADTIFMWEKWVDEWYKLEIFQGTQERNFLWLCIVNSSSI